VTSAYRTAHEPKPDGTLPSFGPAQSCTQHRIFRIRIHSTVVQVVGFSPSFVWSIDTFYQFLRNARLVISSFSRLCVICLTLSVIPGLGFHRAGRAKVCLTHCLGTLGRRGPGSPPFDGLPAILYCTFGILFSLGSISKVEVGSAIRKI
jgi:hypothetical protein